MNIQVSHLDQNGNKIPSHSANGATSFIVDFEEFKSRDSKFSDIPWDKIEVFVSNGISWEGQYILGSSLFIEAA